MKCPLGIGYRLVFKLGCTGLDEVRNFLQKRIVSLQSYFTCHSPVKIWGEIIFY